MRTEHGVLSGPLIQNILSARLTGTKQTRDGDIEDKSGNQNPNSIGDENYALYLRWTPTDSFEFNTRGNVRNALRRMGGADAGGIVTLLMHRLSANVCHLACLRVRCLAPAVRRESYRPV